MYKILHDMALDYFKENYYYKSLIISFDRVIICPCQNQTKSLNAKTDISIIIK